MKGRLADFFLSVGSGHRRFIVLTRANGTSVSCWAVFLREVLSVSFETGDKVALQLLQKAAEGAGLSGWCDRINKGLCLRLKQKSRVRLVMRNGKMQQVWEQPPPSQVEQFVRLLGEAGFNTSDVSN
jgi:hypothetical protein